MSCNGKKILIAEDDPVAARLLQFNLEKLGIETITCRDGSSVETAASKNKPDMLIFDLGLPGKTGQALIQYFKKDEQLKNLPIIVITSQGKASARSELLGIGAYEVLTKPFSPKRLSDIINNFFSKTLAE